MVFTYIIMYYLSSNIFAPFLELGLCLLAELHFILCTYSFEIFLCFGFLHSLEEIMHSL